METSEKSFIESISQFIRKSVTLKLLSIFILMLLLMLPMAFIKELIRDRDLLHQTAITEVSNKWANQQTVYGPVMTIPFNKTIIEGGKSTIVRDKLHILPSRLNINGKVEPRSLTRGIYEVVVYDSRLSFSGDFDGIEKYLDEMKDYELIWDEAFLTVNISDLRGIKDKVIMNWNGNQIAVEPGSQIPELLNSGITVNNILNTIPLSGELKFSFDLHLQGSQYLGFVPLGKETNVKLSSNWQDPSFVGSFLPDDRTVDNNGFNASYKVLELNRNYPQWWIGNQNLSSVQNSAFGVNLLLPVDDYQKSTRSAKYALLSIVLTFLTFFLVEIFNRKRVHPFQYILIGLALTLFYTLLVSISEHTSFNVAYIISSIAVIAMIGLYSRSILDNLKQTLILVLILCLTYTFIYVTLQLEDYALLIGSIGLSAILALTMFITRNVNWYELSSLGKSETKE